MKKFWIAALIAALVLGGVGAWFGRPIYKRHREQRFLAHATAFMQKRDFGEAQLGLRQTLETNPRNAEACRLMADLADMHGSPHALGWRQRVAELKPTVDNRIILASCALRYEQPPYPVAAKTLGELREIAKDKAPYHAVAAQLALMLNQSAVAETHFQEAIKLDPGNQSYQYNLAVVRLKSADPKVAAEARTALERLRADPKFGISALRSLVADSFDKKDFKAAEQLSQKLLGDPASVFSDRTAHLAILHESNRADFTRYLETLQKEAATNTNHIYEISTRMIVYGLSDGALAWLRSLPPDVQSQNPVQLAVANCHEAKADWPGLERVLHGQRWGQNEFTRLALLSRSMRMQGDPAVAHANWLLAMQAAEQKLEQLVPLARLASDWKWEAETQEVLWMILKKFPQEQWVMPELYQFYATRGNSQGVLELFGWMMKFDASDPTAKNNFASVSLLLNVETNKAHALAREVYEREPASPVFVATYAYSLHLLGKTQEGLKLISALKSQDLQNPSIALYYGVLLSATGDSATAQKYLAQAEKAPLLPEEKTLLASAKK